MRRRDYRAGLPLFQFSIFVCPAKLLSRSATRGKHPIQRGLCKAGRDSFGNGALAPPGRQSRTTDAAFAAPAKVNRMSGRRPSRPRRALQPGTSPHKILRKRRNKAPLGVCRGDSLCRSFSRCFFWRQKKRRPPPGRRKRKEAEGLKGSG